MAGTRFDCKEHSLFDGSGTAAGGAGGGPGVRGLERIAVHGAAMGLVAAQALCPGAHARHPDEAPQQAARPAEDAGGAVRFKPHTAFARI